MLKLFMYDNQRNEVIINEPDILLIKEFSELWTNERNITKGDKTGINRTRAFRELKYIYLAIDWKSPYNQYTEMEKHDSAMVDADLSKEEFDDPVFRTACRKYKELQERSKIGSLLQSQRNMVDRMRIYYDTLNFDERDEAGKPIFKMKDVLAEVASTAKMIEGINALEELYKKEQEAENELRGDQQAGLFD